MLGRPLGQNQRNNRLRPSVFGPARAVSQLLWPDKDRDGFLRGKARKGLWLPRISCTRHSPSAILCGFLHGKPHAVRWHDLALQEIRVRSIPVAGPLKKVLDPLPIPAYVSVIPAPRGISFSLRSIWLRFRLQLEPGAGRGDNCHRLCVFGWAAEYHPSLGGRIPQFQSNEAAATILQAAATDGSNGGRPNHPTNTGYSYHNPLVLTQVIGTSHLSYQ